jgi:hypothetical protein
MGNTARSFYGQLVHSSKILNKARKNPMPENENENENEKNPTTVAKQMAAI